MPAGIRDILLIATPRDRRSFQEFQENGSNFGLNIVYAEQANPRGLDQAFLTEEPIIGSSMPRIGRQHLLWARAFRESFESGIVS